MRSATYNHMHRNDPALQDERREEAIEARAAEILADDDELLDASCENPDVARALCNVIRHNMDRTNWTRGGLYADILTPPPVLLFATAALRAALYEVARKQVDKEIEGRKEP